MYIIENLKYQCNGMNISKHHNSELASETTCLSADTINTPMIQKAFCQPKKNKPQLLIRALTLAAYITEIKL